MEAVLEVKEKKDIKIKKLKSRIKQLESDVHQLAEIQLKTIESHNDLTKNIKKETKAMWGEITFTSTILTLVVVGVAWLAVWYLNRQSELA